MSDLEPLPETPSSRFHRAQRTFDGIERQRDKALVTFIEEPSVDNQQHLLEAMAGLRQARRELNASVISVMYFLVTQEMDSDEERAAMEQIVRSHGQRIANLEAQAKEDGA